MDIKREEREKRVCEREEGEREREREEGEREIRSGTSIYTLSSMCMHEGL